MVSALPQTFVPSFQVMPGSIAVGAGERLWRLIGGKCVSAASHGERQGKNKYRRSHSNPPRR